MYFSSSDETAVENWTNEQYDLNSDQYINESTNLGLFQGAMSSHVDDNSVSEVEEESGRRVIREIIV
ncbi:hypothetical protein NECAME_15480 [Necator americanus]|uniref:Uncharacterized protein n=1 Tax=Necator americanus TaxID=51031 RepID=W2SHU5_NECAM|nr:hypothetical protein NECAME_15480 [Necator americanus]ETN69170.1 hypothetical protein NECAME_15480 [Necator americanus]